MDIKAAADSIVKNGGVTVSIDTLYDLLRFNTESEKINKSDIRELIEELEERE